MNVISQAQIWLKRLRHHRDAQIVGLLGLRSVSHDLSTPDLLRFLIKERFPRKILVTASLKAPGVAVLKMMADIDPATPVVSCTRGFQVPARR